MSRRLNRYLINSYYPCARQMLRSSKLPYPPLRKYKGHSDCPHLRIPVITFTARPTEETEPIVFIKVLSPAQSAFWHHSPKPF